MAQRVLQTLISQEAMVAHNTLHAMFAGNQVHNDGPEYTETSSGTPPRPTALLLGSSSPAGAADAAALIIAAKTFINLHLAYADEVTGELWYAHKAADALHQITSSMGPWSNVEADMLEAARLLVNDLSTMYERHRLNNGGTWHTGIDTANILGTPTTYTSGQWTAQIGVERTNMIKALYTDHIVKTTGSTHAMADATNGIAAGYVTYSPTSGPDWTAWIALLTELKTDFNLHRSQAGVHAANDTVNIVTAALPAVPSGTFDLVNEIITDWNAHVADTTFHNSADTGSQISIGTVTSISEMITVAQELYTKANEHVRNAPSSRPIRRVA